MDELGAHRRFVEMVGFQIVSRIKFENLGLRALPNQRRQNRMVFF
jgi:hypothetical protein